MLHRNIVRCFKSQQVWSIRPRHELTRLRAFAKVHQRLLHASNYEVEPGLLNLLKERGYIKDIAGDENTLRHILNTRRVGFYAGVDPTAPSLHLGHLLPLMVLFWLYIHGHHAVSLIGGATAQVGDPSGRLTTRDKTEQTIQERNAISLQRQVEQVWKSVETYAEKRGYTQKVSWSRSVLNNADWLLKLNIVEFLRTLGSGMRIGTMLGRDTVRNKMEKGDGMSLAEFTYPLLQGWDWWHMFRNHNVQIQIGGSDQYGNIIAGIESIKYCLQSDTRSDELVSRLTDDGKIESSHSPMGITTPLLTTARGEKFGKSAGNAIWLDASMTQPFDLYGFLLRTADDDVEKYLNLFTFLDLSVIREVMQRQRLDPSKREAQHLLAMEVLELVHGTDIAHQTQNSHKALRNPDAVQFASASDQSQSDQVSGVSGQRIILPRSLVTNAAMPKILYIAGLTASRSEAARIIKNGGAYVAVPQQAEESRSHFIHLADQTVNDIPSYVNSSSIIIRLGKWKVRQIEIVDDDEYEKRGLSSPAWTEWKTIGKS